MYESESTIELQEIHRILSQHQGGIYKRIDEGRELLVLLQEAAPVLLAAFPRIECWIHKQDDFLVQLSCVSSDPEANPVPGYGFPRPLPKMKYSHVIIDEQEEEQATQ